IVSGFECQTFTLTARIFFRRSRLFVVSEKRFGKICEKGKRKREFCMGKWVCVYQSGIIHVLIVVAIDFVKRLLLSLSKINELHYTFGVREKDTRQYLN